MGFLFFVTDEAHTHTQMITRPAIHPSIPRKYQKNNSVTHGRHFLASRTPSARRRRRDMKAEKQGRRKTCGGEER